MRKYKFLLVLMGIISTFIAGCSNEIKDVEQSIEVQKRIGVENNYENFKVITDNEEVKKVREILEGIDWDNVKVEMSRPADYRFSFPNPEAKVVLYELWISPNKDKVELGIDAQSKYAQLENDTSAELFEILTGEKLAEQK